MILDNLKFRDTVGMLHRRLKLIALKEAFKIAQASDTFGLPLSRIADETKDFWFFNLDAEEVVIGACSIRVDNKDGSVWGASPMHMTDEQLDAWENARQVVVPQE